MDEVGGVGQALRAAREARGLTVGQVSQDTKIPEHYLGAIEAGRFEDLPAPVYVRGLVRLYAGALDLPADDLVRRLGPRWLAPGLGPPPAAPAAPAMPVPGMGHERPPVAAEPEDLVPRRVPGQVPAAPVTADLVIGVDIGVPAPADAREPAPLLIDDLAASSGGDQPPLAHGTGDARAGRVRLTAVVAVALLVAVAAAAIALRGGGEAARSQRASTPADGPVATATIAVAATAVRAEEPAPSASPLPATATVTIPAVAPPALPTTTATAPPPTPAPTATAVPTAPPTPFPTPTPISASVPAAPSAPPVPANPFAQCTSLGGDVFDCGPEPWRVICTPFGRFVDIQGVTPRPIPVEWPGWRETSISQRLENIYGAC